MCDQHCADIVPLRRVDADARQHSLQCQFDDLLRLAHDVGEGFRIHQHAQGKHALRDAREVTAGKFVGGHNSMRSPRRKSGFSSR
jgi:hypothetical protein